MRLEDPRDRPRVARHLQCHPVTNVKALAEQLQRLRARLDPASGPQPPVFDDRDLAEVAMDIQRYRSHSLLLAVDDIGEKRWANDIDGSALAAQPGKSQGRPLKSPGSKPIAQNGLPSLRSPEGPCPSRPNLSPAPDDTSAFKEQFHAARSASSAAGAPAASRPSRGPVSSSACLPCSSARLASLLRQSKVADATSRRAKSDSSVVGGWADEPSLFAVAAARR